MVDFFLKLEFNNTLDTNIKKNVWSMYTFNIYISNDEKVYNNTL